MSTEQASPDLGRLIERLRAEEAMLSAQIATCESDLHKAPVGCSHCKRDARLRGLLTDALVALQARETPREEQPEREFTPEELAKLQADFDAFVARREARMRALEDNVSLREQLAAAEQRATGLLTENEQLKVENGAMKAAVNLIDDSERHELRLRVAELEQTVRTLTEERDRLIGQ